MGIQCELSMPKQLPGGPGAELVFTLTNVGTNVLHVLKWQTPFESIAGPMFTVTRDGADVEYHGRMLKRGNPRQQDYLVLKPGERQQATIDLAEGWDVAAPGKYAVAYSSELFDVIAAPASAPRTRDEFKAVALSCNPVAFTRLR